MNTHISNTNTVSASRQPMPRMLFNILVFIFVAMLSGCSGDRVVLPEHHEGSDALVNHMLTNIENNDSLRLVADIDHSRLGQEVGSVMPPARVLIFSDPRLESSLINENPLVAIDLPLRVLAYQIDPETPPEVIFNSYAYLQSRYDLMVTPQLEAMFNTAMSSVLTGIAREDIAQFGQQKMKPDGIITLDSPFDFETTLQRVQQAIDSQDDTIGFGRIDFHAQAKTIGVDINPSTLILFGGPSPGARAMSDSPTLGLDAFCQKMLIWQDNNGNVRLSFNDLLMIADRQQVNKSIALRVINYRLKTVFEAALEQ